MEAALCDELIKTLKNRFAETAKLSINGAESYYAARGFRGRLKV